MVRSGLRYGEGTIERRTLKDGRVRFLARWSEPRPGGGRQWHAKTFDAEVDARAYLMRVADDRRTNRYEPESRLTVGQAVAEYIERAKRRISANTVRLYAVLLRTDIAPVLGDVRVADIRTRDVQRLLDAAIDRGLSPGAVATIKTLISATLKELAALGVIPSNPARDARSPAVRHADRTVWTASDVSRFLASIAGDVMATAFYVTALTTGMRPGELNALSWAHVDLDAGLITVARTVTRDADGHECIGSETKTRRTRTIAIPRQTVAALQAARLDQIERRLATRHWYDTGLVFDLGNGKMVLSSTRRQRHTAYCKAAGVPRIRMHDLRHTAATLMLANGVNLKIVSEILGHSSIATTADIYSHVDTAMQRTATDILGEIAECNS